jgi:hypothetical protein
MQGFLPSRLNSPDQGGKQTHRLPGINAVYTGRTGRGPDPFQGRFSGVSGRPPIVEASRFGHHERILMRTRTIVFLVLAGVIGVFVLVGLAGVFLAA